MTLCAIVESVTSRDRGKFKSDRRPQPAGPSPPAHTPYSIGNSMTVDILIQRHSNGYLTRVLRAVGPRATTLAHDTVLAPPSVSPTGGDAAGVRDTPPAWPITTGKGGPPAGAQRLPAGVDLHQTKRAARRQQSRRRAAEERQDRASVRRAAARRDMPPAAPTDPVPNGPTTPVDAAAQPRGRGTPGRRRWREHE